LAASLVLSVAGLSAAIVRVVVITTILVLLTWVAPAEAVRAEGRPWRRDDAASRRRRTMDALSLSELEGHLALAL
jgi:hypothetical protein